MEQTTKERADVRKVSPVSDTETHKRTEEQKAVLEKTDELLGEIDDLLDEPKIEMPLIFLSPLIKALFDWAEAEDVGYDLVIENGVVVNLLLDSFCICG